MTKINCRAFMKIITKKEKTQKNPQRWSWLKVTMFLKNSAMTILEEEFSFNRVHWKIFLGAENLEKYNNQHYWCF